MVPLPPAVFSFVITVIDLLDGSPLRGRWLFLVLFAGLVQVRASLHNGSKQLN